MNYKGLGKPFETNQFKIYNCDNMELLKQTPDNYYSLSIVDPPYGETCKLSGGKAKKDGYADYWDKITDDGNWHHVVFVSNGSGGGLYFDKRTHLR